MPERKRFFCIDVFPNISDFFTASHRIVEVIIVDTTSYVHLGPTGRGFGLRIAMKFLLRKYKGRRILLVVICDIPIMEMNHLLFFAMLVRMLVANSCFILLSIPMTCSSSSSSSPWPVQVFKQSPRIFSDIADCFAHFFLSDCARDYHPQRPQDQSVEMWWISKSCSHEYL